MIRHPRRAGLSLLEVLLSLTIFLVALGALHQLMSFSSDQAEMIQQRSYAATLAQSQLAKVISGIVPIAEGVSDTPVEEDEDYQWSMQSEPSVIEGLYTVVVTVYRDMGNGRKVQFVLAQMIVDPAKVGSNQDQAAIEGAIQAGSSQGSTTTDSTTKDGTTKDGTTKDSSLKDSIPKDLPKDLPKDSLPKDLPKDKGGK